MSRARWWMVCGAIGGLVGMAAAIVEQAVLHRKGTTLPAGALTAVIVLLVLHTVRQERG